MKRSTVDYVLLACMLQVSALISHASTLDLKNDPSKRNDYSLNIDDSKCRIGIALVRLSVGELTSESGNLVGDYTIVVPLMKSKNDKGRIIIPLNDETIRSLSKNGGTLNGKAISNKEGKDPNKIICEVLPRKNNTVLLKITTEDRTLEFKSNFSVSDNATDN